MQKEDERVYKFGDYCLDIANSIFESHYSMSDIFEAIQKPKDAEFKERLIEFVNGYLDYIDNCIKEANSLLKTLPFVIGYMRDVVDIKALETTSDKLIDIREDTESRIKSFH